MINVYRLAFTWASGAIERYGAQRGVLLLAA